MDEHELIAWLAKSPLFWGRCNVAEREAGEFPVYDERLFYSEIRVQIFEDLRQLIHGGTLSKKWQVRRILREIDTHDFRDYKRFLPAAASTTDERGGSQGSVSTTRRLPKAS